MIRTGKITLVAVLALSIGGLALLFGWVALASPKINRHISLMIILFGIWGVATGLGALRLQRWARVSVFAFSALISFFAFAIWPLVVFLKIHRRPGGPLLGEGAKAMILGLLAIVVLTGLWLGYALVTESSRKAFGILSPPQPFSIAIIGWFLIMSGIYEVMFFGFRNSPMMLFGFVFAGRSATVAELFYIAVHLSIGIGLLVRKEKMRMLAIYYCIFQLCDIAVFCLRPDREATVRTYFSARALYRATSATTLPIDALTRYLNLVSLEWGGLALIAIWFLLKRREEVATPVAASQENAE